MIDYGEMSDFDLSRAILTINHSNIKKHRGKWTNGQSKAEAELLPKCEFNATLAAFDINNWSDMGPLIHENKISIHYRANPKLPPMAKRINSDQHNETHSNELRAAAIVYLKSMESKNDS